ncbi:alpha/beta hydrolase [bacterium]|nr:alpha/beta hydrolase [candidate division CSSED10-310 bacterium]
MTVFQPVQKTLLTDDGVTIAYQTAGTPGRHAIVLANGLGGRMATWTRIAEYFANDYQIISWDHRGFFDSSRPGSPEHMDIPCHADDLRRVMQEAGVEQAVVFGWSMGTQIVLEFYRRHPGACRGMVLVNGTYGRENGIGGHVHHRFTIDTLAAALAFTNPVLRGFVRMANAFPYSLPVMKRLGFTAETIDAEILDRVKKDLTSIDFETFGRMLQYMSRHSIKDLLPTIAVPTLVISSCRDRLAPCGKTRLMQEMIPGSELLEVKLGTHYAPLEFPELINLRIEKFFQKHGF